MKKKVFLIFMFIIVSTVVFANVVAVFDGKEITDADLKDYVNKVAGKKYDNYLKSKDGRRKLAEFYIERELLLNYARSIYKEKDINKLKHSHPNLDIDTLYLLHLIDDKVNGKIKVEEKELESFMKSNGITNKNEAFAKLLSIKRKKTYDELIQQLKKDHKIEFVE
ncbi:conserved hypothetical protein [Deferribacter desulfuricans SSM1]|uniref:Uncharacterized protein n=1 Tax=Deferribacter desulfuricans (strain DSM 14783 / JCM 11476 / NBRC 101012 / SSM1) TaxID=639282 RepID=D3P982_DEFDS|nr:hypothetical protein [Deferribacter desulfuricans]BAI81272.1 conserved hypothetical protein [Deferribacter desulfuricans SSM1]